MTPFTIIIGVAVAVSLSVGIALGFLAGHSYGWKRCIGKLEATCRRRGIPIKVDRARKAVSFPDKDG